MIGHSKSVPSAESSPPGNGKHRGGLQPPHTAQAERSSNAREFQRVTVFRLEPSKEQYALLKLRDAQATQYLNAYSIHLYCERRGYRPAEGAAKQKLTSVDHATPGDLSSAIYVACQRRVQDDWKRIGKRIWSGVQVPIYRKGCLRFDSGGRPERGGTCGAQIVRTDDGGYAARLHVTASRADGDNWIMVPVYRRTEKDDYRAQLLAEFADGKRHIQRGEVAFQGNKVLLRVSYKVTRDVPAVGERVATLSELEDGRLLLRTEFGLLDFSSRLYGFKEKKMHWDGIRRRLGRRMCRSKGSSRRLSRKLDMLGFDRWSNDQMHKWSREMAGWAFSQGCGFFTVAQLIGSDWPAHKLEAMLKYKAEEMGMKFVEASLEQEPTERAAKAAIRKKRLKAKKLADAQREIVHQISGENNG